jgi:hypothetical protein
MLTLSSTVRDSFLREAATTFLPHVAARLTCPRFYREYVIYKDGFAGIDVCVHAFLFVSFRPFGVLSRGWSGGFRSDWPPLCCCLIRFVLTLSFFLFSQPKCYDDITFKLDVYPALQERTDPETLVFLNRS